MSFLRQKATRGSAFPSALWPAGTVTGRVVDGGGNGVGGATLHIRYSNERRRHFLHHEMGDIHADDSGYFTLPVVARGRNFVVEDASEGHLPGSTDTLKLEEEKLDVQVRWSELKKLVDGKKVTLQLAEGARVGGRGGENPEGDGRLAYLQGQEEFRSSGLPQGKDPDSERDYLSNRSLKENKGRRVGATVGTAAGAYIGSLLALVGKTASESEPSKSQVSASIAIATGAAILVNQALRNKSVTLIEILPDSPSESEPKPSNEDSTPRPKQNTSSP